MFWNARKKKSNNIGPKKAINGGKGNGSVPEGSFRVDVEALSLGASHVNGQLTCDGHGVTKLTLSRSELAEKLGDRTRLDATVQQLVQLLRTCGVNMAMPIFYKSAFLGCCRCGSMPKYVVLRIC